MHESEWLTGGSWRGLRAAIAAWAIVRLIESGISKVVADLNGARTTLVIVEWLYVLGVVCGRTEENCGH